MHSGCAKCLNSLEDRNVSQRVDDSLEGLRRIEQAESPLCELEESEKCSYAVFGISSGAAGIFWLTSESSKVEKTLQFVK